MMTNIEQVASIQVTKLTIRNCERVLSLKYLNALSFSPLEAPLKLNSLEVVAQEIVDFRNLQDNTLKELFYGATDYNKYQNWPLCANVESLTLLNIPPGKNWLKTFTELKELTILNSLHAYEKLNAEIASCNTKIGTKYYPPRNSI